MRSHDWNFHSKFFIRLRIWWPQSHLNIHLNSIHTIIIYFCRCANCDKRRKENAMVRREMRNHNKKRESTHAVIEVPVRVESKKSTLHVLLIENQRHLEQQRRSWGLNESIFIKWSSINCAAHSRLRCAQFPMCVFVFLFLANSLTIVRSFACSFDFPWASFDSYLQRMQKQKKDEIQKNKIKLEENEDKFLVN